MVRQQQLVAGALAPVWPHHHTVGKLAALTPGQEARAEPFAAVPCLRHTGRVRNWPLRGGDRRQEKRSLGAGSGSVWTQLEHLEQISRPLGAQLGNSTSDWETGRCKLALRHCPRQQVQLSMLNSVIGLAGDEPCSSEVL